MPRVSPSSRSGPSPRAGVNDRPSSLKLAWRRQRRLLRRVLIGLVALAVVIAPIWLVRQSADGSVFGALRQKLATSAAAAGLRVHDVQILGRENTPEPLLRAAIGIAPDDPILGVSVAEIRSRVETLNWVEHVSVERRLPSTIVVQLSERRPFAIWQHQNKFSLIDRQGQVVADQNLASYGQLPLVVGPGAPIAAAPLLDLMRDRPAIADRVVAAVRVGERRWNLRLISGADVLLPEGADRAALDRLIELQQTEALLDRPVQIIDLRLADRLVVRPLGEAHSAPASGPAGTGALPGAVPGGAPLAATTHRSI